MIKIPYEVLAIQIDKLYEKEFESHDLSGIDKQCDFIATFIQACGWDEESFVRAMFGFEPLDKQLN